jgi:hypothetical protein
MFQKYHETQLRVLGQMVQMSRQLFGIKVKKDEKQLRLQ